MGKLMSEESKNLFPLSTISGLLNLFDNEFLAKQNDSDPDSDGSLALLSIILGAVEHSLTFPTSSTTSGGSSSHKPRGNKIPEQLTYSPDGTNAGISNATGSKDDFPKLEYDSVYGLVDKLRIQLFTAFSNSDLYNRDRVSPDGTSVELIKSVSDIFWHSLSRNSSDRPRPHMQSLFTFLTSQRLDSFGLAVSVVAACQILGLNDVHLVLSEDHAWVTFGKGEQKGRTAEVTWHGGKRNEDKRGRPVDDNTSWLYLKGYPVVCSRLTEAAAIVCAINPSVGSAESLEMRTIQQKLLWKLYDPGHLQQYPIAVGHLADLEETSGTPNAPKTSAELHEEAIASDKQHYNNMHVYPYIHYAEHLYRRDDFKGALKWWAEAAQVISQYRFSRVDEEIYKEFLDISKEKVLSIMKKCSTGFSANSPNRDPTCYADLLRFFDGICLWEELGTTPVLHITWAKCWIGSLGKFESTAREGVSLFDWSEDEASKPCDDVVPPVCDITTPINRSTSSTGITVTDMNGNSKGKGKETQEISVYFKSFKMKSIRTLLEKDKFNSAALTLQLTSQPTLLPAVSGDPSQTDTGPHTFGVVRGRKSKRKGEDEDQSREGSKISKKGRI